MQYFCAFGYLFYNGGETLGLFTMSQLDEINKVAAKSKAALKPMKAPKTKSISDDLNRISKNVTEYFKDSKAICIHSRDELHDYITACIKFGYAGIDTETTGLDRVNDYVVGASLFVPGMPECYIPMKHRVPIFENPYPDQLSYEDVTPEFQRLADEGCKLIFANADYDLAMINKDLKVDFCDACYYDVILAWRCLKEDERDNTLKGLKPAIAGLIFAAGLSMMNTQNFVDFGRGQYNLSVIICVLAFVASYFFKANPILLIVLSGIVGFVAY